MVTAQEVVNAVTAIARIYEDYLMLGFSAMIAFAVAVGVKRIMTE